MTKRTTLILLALAFCGGSFATELYHLVRPAREQERILEMHTAQIRDLQHENELIFKRLDDAGK